MGAWATCPATAQGRWTDSAKTWPQDEEHILGRETWLPVGHAEPKEGPEAQKGIGPTEGCGMGGTQTALTSLHVAKGAKTSCGESAQS